MLMYVSVWVCMFLDVCRGCDTPSLSVNEGVSNNKITLTNNISNDHEVIIFLKRKGTAVYYCHVHPALCCCVCDKT